MKTKATQPLPLAHKKRKSTGEMLKAGQGAGVTPTPKGVQSMVQGLTKHVRPT